MASLAHGKAGAGTPHALPLPQGASPGGRRPLTMALRMERHRRPPLAQERAPSETGKRRFHPPGPRMGGRTACVVHHVHHSRYPQDTSRDALEGWRYPPPPSGRPTYAQPLSPSRQVPPSLAFVTDSNRPQPLWQPPPSTCLTASGAASVHAPARAPFAPPTVPQPMGTTGSRRSWTSS